MRASVGTRSRAFWPGGQCDIPATAYFADHVQGPHGLFQREVKAIGLGAQARAVDRVRRVRQEGANHLASARAHPVYAMRCVGEQNELRSCETPGGCLC